MGGGVKKRRYVKGRQFFWKGVSLIPIMGKLNVPPPPCAVMIDMP